MLWSLRFLEILSVVFYIVLPNTNQSTNTHVKARSTLAEVMRFTVSLHPAGVPMIGYVVTNTYFRRLNLRQIVSRDKEMTNCAAVTDGGGGGVGEDRPSPPSSLKHVTAVAGFNLWRAVTEHTYYKDPNQSTTKQTNTLFFRWKLWFWV